MSFANSTKVSLDLRGQRLSLEREALMELPESVLLCLFPNGVVLSPQRPPRTSVQSTDDDDDDEDVYFVDFDARCLEFVLDFFGAARDAFYGPADGPRRDLSLTSPIAQYNGQNPLFLKQSVIVLREELEYFAIPPGRASATTTAADPHGLDLPASDEAGKPNAALSQLKVDCGHALLEHRSIFTALQRNVSRDNNVAEQHLIDMLCMSGFERDDAWGYRSLEPTRCCIASIALVLLKTGIVHPPIGGGSAAPASATSGEDGSALAASDDGGVHVNTQQLATAQKLLLFWRKPARKVWWDHSTETLASGKEVKIWARRVWTLELSLI